MRILQIAPKIPYPPNDGSKVGIFNLTDQMIKHGAEVFFAAPSGGSVVDPYFESIVHFIPLNIGREYSIAGGIKNLFSSLPFNIEKYLSEDAFQKLSDVYQQNRFDIVHVDHLHMAEYGLTLKKKHGARVVLREHNFESEIMARVARLTRNPIAKFYFHVQHSRIMEFESDVVRRVDVVLPISDVDDRKLANLSPGMKSLVVPAGVDVEKFAPNAAFVPDRVLFLSSYDWLPNLDSFKFYAKEIMPILGSKAPQVKTIVAGKSAQKIPVSWMNRSFEVAGFVSDFNRFSSMASVAVVPLRIGSGMRIKVLELMALGMAIVSTAIGAEGIDAENGKDLLLADTPGEFADRIATLTSSPSLCKEIGNNARRLVSEKYTWESSGEKLFNAYRNILSEHDDRP